MKIEVQTAKYRKEVLKKLLNLEYVKSLKDEEDISMMVENIITLLDTIN